MLSLHGGSTTAPTKNGIVGEEVVMLRVILWNCNKIWRPIGRCSLYRVTKKWDDPSCRSVHLLYVRTDAYDERFVVYRSLTLHSERHAVMGEGSRVWWNA